MQIGKKKILLALAVVSALSAGGYLFFGMSKELKLDNAFVVGRVIRLTAPTAGKVESVNLTRFTVLKGGETAFSINRETATEKVISAEYALRAAFSEAGQACMQLGSQVERVKLTDLTTRLARDKAEDVQKLFERGFVSKRQVDEQQFEEQKAKISSQMERLEQKRLEMEIGRSAPGTTKMTQAIDQLRQALIELRHSTIKMDHEVFTQDVHVLPGQWVDSGALLATVIPVETVRVQANLIESQISQVWVGQSVNIRIDGMEKGQVIRGHVEAIVPATAATFSAVQRNTADSTWIKVAQRIPIVIRIDDPIQTANVHIGQSAEVTFLPGAKTTPVPESSPVVQASNDDLDIEQEISLRVNKERDDVSKYLNLPKFCRLFTLNERIAFGESQAAR